MVREELANACVKNEDTNVELLAAYEELTNVKNENDDKLKELEVAREELANVIEQNDDKLKELAAAHDELAKMSKQNEDGELLHKAAQVVFVTSLQHWTMHSRYLLLPWIWRLSRRPAHLVRTKTWTHGCSFSIA